MKMHEYPRKYMLLTVPGLSQAIPGCPRLSLTVPGLSLALLSCPSLPLEFIPELMVEFRVPRAPKP